MRTESKKYLYDIVQAADFAMQVVVECPCQVALGEAAGAEARFHCSELYTTLEAPLFHGRARFCGSSHFPPSIKNKIQRQKQECPLHTISLGAG